MTTAKQLEALQAINQYVRLHGFSPTIYELQKALSLASPSGVQSRLSALSHSGFIQWERHKSRTIRITPTGERLL
jgi:repressor LexA